MLGPINQAAVYQVMIVSYDASVYH